jgi:hypothetical protein
VNHEGGMRAIIGTRRAARCPVDPRPGTTARRASARRLHRAPVPAARVHTAHGRRIRRLLSSLVGLRFAPGDRVQITTAAPGHRPERIQLRTRSEWLPLAQLLSN